MVAAAELEKGARGLTERLTSFSSGLSEHELENFKLLLGIAAGGLAPHASAPRSATAREAFRAVVGCLGRVERSGVVWRGRLPFVTPRVLAQLQTEARARRKTAKRTDRYFLECGGRVADRLASSRALSRFVAQHAACMRPTGVASYIFYDQPGDGQDPHIDTETFTLNVIFMVDHRFDAAPSHLLIYPSDSSPERIRLAPGETLLLYAGSTVHAREDVRDGEAVDLLTIGFEPSSEWRSP